MNKKFLTTANLVKISLLSAIAFILISLDFPIPFLFPGFLKLDFSDVPALIGGFSMGPLAGVLIQLIKCVLHMLTQTETAGVGPASNFVTGVSLVVPATIIYRWIKSKKGALLGLVAGTVVMTGVMALANYYVFFPLFITVMGYSEEAVVGMGTAVNSNITDLKTLVILGSTPFNIFKGATVSIVTLALYKHISRLFKRYN